ncbi:cell division protein FtsQ/DivIB [Persicitalea sp.]|uniref:cell division protein FtsQ/DivIB n=1 Tax=Persicitalea sp. TaxID=3100273 RepID=UPI003593A8E9
MLRNFDYYKKWLGKIVWFGVFLLCVGMAESKLNRQQCDDLLVKVDYDSGIRFVNQADIEKILTENGSDPVHGNRQQDVSLKTLENRVRANKLVEDCQVYHDLEGNLVVDIQQEKPLARYVGESRQGEWRGTNGFYINPKGDFIPLTERFSARVLLVSGDFFKNKKHLHSESEKKVVDMIAYLSEDDFWKAQVIQMEVSKSGNVEFLTALGDQRIEFGKAENVAAKLLKLRVFYNKVMAADWGRYTRINLRFRDQVVCE